jgi:hypothetical protein
MAYSCNNNQNYFIQDNRSTSRVLQPPGGVSSFSIGGGNFSADHQRGTNRHQKLPKPTFQGHFDQHSTGRNVSWGVAGDSLDALVDNRLSATSSRGGGGGARIPGLESHYNEAPRQRVHSAEASYQDTSYDTRFEKPLSGLAPTRMIKGPLGAKEYASLLREQIEFKNGSGKENGHRSTNRQNHHNHHYSTDRDEQKLAVYYTNNGQRRMPPGGASTFSLGWN